MPTTAQDITTSGIGPTDAQAVVYVTYDSQQLQYGLPQPNTGNIDIIPGFMFLMGSVKFRKDSAGNVLAENPNKDGSLPL